MKWWSYLKPQLAFEFFSKAREHYGLGFLIDQYYMEGDEIFKINRGII